MGIWYVKKSDNKVKVFKKLFNILTINETQNRTIIELPIENEKYANEKLQIKIAEKIAKKMYDKPNQNLVLASNIDLKMFKDTLYSYNCNILDGRWLFKYLIPQIVDYVAEKEKKETQELEVAIMSNDNSENNLKIIVQLAQKVKMLSIITSDIDKFKQAEEYLFESMGIVIRTTSNKKKALLKQNLIFNIDFPEEVINQYAIAKKTIIVNLSEKINIKSKRFEGINCNYYSVLLSDEYKKWFENNNIFQGFDEATLLESMVFSKNSYEAIEEKLKDVTVNGLIGNNGIICDREFLTINEQKL